MIGIKFINLQINIGELLAFNNGIVMAYGVTWDSIKTYFPVTFSHVSICYTAVTHEGWPNDGSANQYNQITYLQSPALTSFVLHTAQAKWAATWIAIGTI